MNWRQPRRFTFVSRSPQGCVLRYCEGIPIDANYAVAASLTGCDCISITKLPCRGVEARLKTTCGCFASRATSGKAIWNSDADHLRWIKTPQISYPIRLTSTPILIEASHERDDPGRINLTELDFLTKGYEVSGIGWTKTNSRVCGRSRGFGRGGYPTRGRDSCHTGFASASRQPAGDVLG